jgi:hypothetical protein
MRDASIRDIGEQCAAFRGFQGCPGQGRVEADNTHRFSRHFQAHVWTLSLAGCSTGARPDLDGLRPAVIVTPAR